MRIGIVSFAWTDQNNGGLRSHVKDLAQDLRELGASIFVHCVNTDPDAPIFESRSWQEDGISIHELNHANQQATTLFDLQKVPQAEAILREWCLREKLDLVHIHHNLFIGMGAIEALADYCPVITSLHDYWPLDPLGQLFDHKSMRSMIDQQSWEDRLRATWPNMIKKSHDSHQYFCEASEQKRIHQPNLQKSWIAYSRRCLSRSRDLISPSQATASIFRDHGIEQPITVVENGIQSREIAASLRRDCLEDKRPTGKIKLSILGNIVPPKGQLQFCKTCLTLPYKDEIEIRLYGEFPKDYQGERHPQDELRNLLHTHPDLFSYKGAYKRSQLLDIYRHTDIAIVPSLWEEVYGLVAREALGYGLPLITTSAGGLESLKSINTTLILDHQNPSSWSKALTLAYTEGPLLKWVYHRRHGISTSNFIPRSSQSCAADLFQIYTKSLAI